MNLILFALRVFTQTGVLICTFYIHKNQVFTVLPYKWIAVRVVLCAVLGGCGLGGRNEGNNAKVTG